MIYISTFQPVNNMTPSSGLGKIAFNLFNNLRDKENIEIYFSSKGNISSSSVKDLGKIYFLLYRILGRFSKFIPYFLVRHFQEILYDLFFTRKINKNITLLITTNPWMPLSLKKAKKLGVKVFLIAGNANDNMIFDLVKLEKNKFNIKDSDPFDYLPRLRRYNKSMQNIDSIIAINEYIYDSFNNYSFSNKKLILMPTLFDADYEKFNIEKRITSKFTIFYCAHTSILKGLHILIEAFSNFKAGKNDVELVIGGNLNLNYLDKLIKEIDGNNIKMLGTLDSSEIANQLKYTSIFVVPSLTDAGPVTMIEAMYSKTPVLCSDGVGNKWLIEDGINGFVYKKKSIAELTKKLNFAYNNKNNLIQMGENAKKKVLDVISEKEAFYSDIIKVLSL